MIVLEELQASLEALTLQRSQMLESGWLLPHCWLVQVKPGGTARTDSKYWQVRSRQPIFAGKKLKHLQPDEVEAYRAAIARGRQLKQLEQQIDKLQRQIRQLTGTASQSPPLPTVEPARSLKVHPLQLVPFATLSEQEQLVNAVLADSRSLREALRQAVKRSQQLEARNLAIRKEQPPFFYWDV